MGIKKWLDEREEKKRKEELKYNEELKLRALAADEELKMLKEREVYRKKLDKLEELKRKNKKPSFFSVAGKHLDGIQDAADKFVGDEKKSILGLTGFENEENSDKKSGRKRR